MPIISNKKRLYLNISAIILAIVLAFYLAYTLHDNPALERTLLEYGYAGIFVASVLSGINIILPVPIVSFMPLFIESGLSFYMTIFIISLGLTLGDGLAYAIGLLGRKYSSESLKKRISYFDNLREKHFWWPLLILGLFASTVPFPNEVLVIPMAFVGYRWTTMMPFLLIGNLIFNILAATGLVRFFDLVF